MSWPSSPTPKGENWRSLLCHGEKGGLHYRVFSGTRTDLPPLILIHGSPMPSACFDQLLKALPRDRSIFVPDLPGFGASSHGFSDFSFHAHRQALAQLLAHEKIQTAHWLAYSQGGGPVIELAAQQASAFSSLTLLSSIGIQEHELTGDYFLNHILHGAQWVALEALRWGTPHFGLLDQFLLNTHYAKNFYQSDLRPLRSHLSQFSPPTLIIHGQQDRLVTPASAREHQRIIPHSELTWLEGGHMILMSQPHLVATPLLEFLKKVDAGTAASRAQASTSRHQAC
jgi:pimeloyl-ACP methyl ester carboxylesterase